MTVGFGVGFVFKAGAELTATGGFTGKVGRAAAGVGKAGVTVFAGAAPAFGEALAAGTSPVMAPLSQI